MNKPCDICQAPATQRYTDLMQMGTDRDGYQETIVVSTHHRCNQHRGKLIITKATDAERNELQQTDMQPK